jgi:hypothetical protein
MTTLTEDLTKLGRKIAVDNPPFGASQMEALSAIAGRLREHRDETALCAICRLLSGVFPKFSSQAESIEAQPPALALYERTKMIEKPQSSLVNLHQLV